MLVTFHGFFKSSLLFPSVICLFLHFSQLYKSHTFLFPFYSMRNINEKYNEKWLMKNMPHWGSEEQQVVLCFSRINRGQCDFTGAEPLSVREYWTKLSSTKARKYYIIKSSWEPRCRRLRISGNLISFIVWVRVSISESCLAFCLSASY